MTLDRAHTAIPLNQMLHLEWTNDQEAKQWSEITTEWGIK